MSAPTAADIWPDGGHQPVTGMERDSPPDTSPQREQEIREAHERRRRIGYRVEWYAESRDLLAMLDRARAEPPEGPRG